MLLLHAPVGEAGTERTHSIELLYIDANVDGSSGGHSALKMGDSVYHYQNDQNFTRLTRENWRRFRFDYNDLENRSLYGLQIAVSAADEQAIRDRLNTLFMVQNRHMQHLEALQLDAPLLRAQAMGDPVLIAGVDFFDRHPQEAAGMSGLLDWLTQETNPDFLNTVQRHALRELTDTTHPALPVQSAHPVADRYPAYSATASEQIQQAYSRWFASTAILEGWPIAADRLIDITALLSDPPSTPAMTDQEENWLRRYRTRLQHAILAELKTPTTTGNSHLLLMLARHEAVSQSLATHRLQILDVLPPAHASATEPLATRETAGWRQLAQRTEAIVQDLRTTVFAEPEPEEPAFNRLEMAASEAHDIRLGLNGRGWLRTSRDAGLPSGVGYVLLPPIHRSADQLAELTERADARAEDFLSQMRELYGYDLIRRNCVTELMRALHSSFVSEAAIAAALGAYLEPGSGQSFIPFRLHELARQHYRVTRETLYPSYRRRYLQHHTATEDGHVQAMLELSPFTSSLYRHRPGDGFFAFFTDDSVWNRPLLGSFNLGFASVASGAGVLMAPWDQGTFLLEGLKGVVFSLPELVGWNIRKGSFDELTVLTEHPTNMASGDAAQE